MTKQMNRQQTTKMTVVSLLSALSLVLYLFLEFPLLPMASWLEMDFSDIPAIIGGILYGPLAGVLIELLKNLIHLMIKGFGTTAGIGNLMNFLVGSAFVLPISFLLKRSCVDKKRLIAGFGLSAFFMLLMGFVGNMLTAPYYITLFFGQEVTLSGALNLAWLATLFNVIKSAILIVITALLLKFVLLKLKTVVDKC